MVIFLGLSESLLASAIAYLILFRISAQIDLDKKGIWLNCKLLYFFFLLSIVCNGLRYAKIGASIDLTREVWIFVMMSASIVLGLYDYQTRKVPNKYLLFLLLLWTVFSIEAMISNFESGIALFKLSFAGALFAGIIFLLCYLLSKGQLGGGDVKFAFILGLYATGELIFGVIIIGVLLCMVYSIGKVLRKKMGWKDSVALLPFLCIGYYISLALV